ncbi:MAG TPA: arginine deiminase-related protein [Anaerolineae bacterium]|nr:arginine deiminase-related protein [Anaerolineae bacterium]
MRAIVRPPGESYARALSSQVPRPAIQVEVARRQHAEYRAALRAAGAELIELPPEEAYPDACFVQDCAVIWRGTATVARFGARSRRGEETRVRTALGTSTALRIHLIEAPGTLEGGDVLAIGSRLVVGLSARTNRAGLAQLRDRLELEGATVEGLAVPEGLHLLSGITYLGRGIAVATDPYAEMTAFSGLDMIQVPAEEAYAANALGLGGAVIVPAGYPQTAKLIRERGFEVLAVDLGEFSKADGGATCLSLIVEP